MDCDGVRSAWSLMETSLASGDGSMLIVKWGIITFFFFLDFWASLSDAQGILLVSSGDHMHCWGSNPDWLGASQKHLTHFAISLAPKVGV